MDLLNTIRDSSVIESRRLYACVELKRRIKSQWNPLVEDYTILVVCIPGESPSTQGFYVSDVEKDEIKNNIVRAMLSVRDSPKLQIPLGEAIAEIGNFDFPLHWSELLSQLTWSLREVIMTNDFNSVNAILTTFGLLFEKFRDPNTLHTYDLKYCLDNNLAEVLLSTVESISGKIDDIDCDVPLSQLVESQMLCSRVFYCLNYLITPKTYEDNFSKWIDAFRGFLVASHPTLEAHDAGLALLCELRVVTCEIISLIMERDDHLFKAYGMEFVEVVYCLLGVSPKKHENFLLTGIRFLKVASTGVHHTFFSTNEVLETISLNIVIPSLMLSDEDEELFIKSCLKFIAADMDLSKRRRAVCELVLGVAENYRDDITRVLLTDVENCLTSYAENPMANWKEKECVIYLVSSLKSLFSDHGTMDLPDFFTKHIVPELQSEDPNAFPMLKAAALRFLTTFRVLLPKAHVMTVLGDVVCHLTSEVETVKSCAAICVEKLFFVKGDGEELRFTSEDVAPIRKQLWDNIYPRFNKHYHEQNKYLDRCITRLLKWPWPVFQYKSD